MGTLTAFAGPEQDFDAAIKAGKPLSAEAAYLKLVKEGAKVSPVRHLLAARVAGQIGKDTARDDRTMLYLRLEKGWNAHVEQALWRLCRKGTDVDLFARLSANAKADRALWTVGRDMLNRLRDANRPSEILKLADILFARFKEPSRRNHVLNVLYENGRNCAPSYPRADLAALIERHGGLGDCEQFWALLNYGNQRDAFSPDFVLNYVARHGGPINDDLLARSMDCLDQNAIGELKADKDAEKIKVRDARLAVLKKIQPVVFDGRHPNAALRYFRIAGLRLPKLVAPGWKGDTSWNAVSKNPVPVPGLVKLYEAVTAQPRFKENPYYRRDVVNQRNALMDWKRFTEAEVAAFKAADAKNPKDNPAVAEAIKEMRGTKDANVRKSAVRKLIGMADRNTTWWNEIEWGCNQCRDDALWYEFRLRRATLSGDFNDLANTYRKGDEKPYAGIDVSKMSARSAYQYTRNLWNNLKAGPARNKAVFDFLASRPYAEFDRDDVNWAVDICRELASRPETVSSVPFDAIAKEVYASKDRFYPWDTYVNLLRIAYYQNKFEPAFRQFQAWADQIDPLWRTEIYGVILSAQMHVPRKDGKGTEWTWILKDDVFRSTATGKYAESIKAVSAVRAPLCSLGLSTGRWGNLQSWGGELAKAKTPPPELAALNALYEAMTTKMLAGAKGTDAHRGHETCAWAYRLKTAIQAKDCGAVAAVARRAATSLFTNWVGDAYLRQLMEDFQTLGNGEVFYLYVDAIAPDQPGWLVSMAAKHRAELASSLPGIYPVAENDPAYPLYVAAEELSRKNPERAWQILQDQKNQTVFEREALKLPPTFVIWGVEQLRMARGEKDALLLKARQIATSILAQESKVPPEVAAAMVLTRAESYRDQQNFEAAKLEYQSLRDNPTYHATKYGKKAMFRATDLQIVSGNLQGVEATLEYWLSQNDREIQAEAHYFLARLAFERKDFDECIKQLRQVFAINYTHTEGRFLHGQWKLATNSEVDDTDVLVGDLAERNMIRPGNQLTVTVQDANLSVAGGGASIPVIVTSRPSGDEERINLYPTSRDPSNFKGLIEVQLGRACPSNRVLEVVGNDIVSYVIDPEFLRERGLPLNVPKKLSVIDDAKLAIGAGAPRTEEKKTETDLKSLMEDDQVEDSGVSRKLRPGNPLYVVVKDRDCSLGGKGDSIRVSVETSSGDKLSNYELKEEKPFTGVFRGKIETSLPPPRAFASDTSAGMNPGDVINRNKSAGWKSLSDSQPGKWFEVDTMGSHLFSEILLETPTVEDIKTLKLVGRMGKKELQLGRLPVPTEMSKLYLRRQQQYDRRPRRSLGQLRAFCQTDRAGKRTIIQKLEHRALGKGNDSQTAFYQGPFLLPRGIDALRFRLQPQSTKKDALRNLWVALAIDGDEIFSGQGVKLQNEIMSVDITPGCHQFELAVVSMNHDDDFDLLWEPLGKEPQHIPADWFDEEQHPVLRRFVKDVVQITKTPNGFKAVFDKPVRLRSFRWEFADVKSPDVAISRISAKDDRGEVVLPVESDFSDSQTNDRLEVAPGDKITVRYEDARTTSGEKKVLQRDISSSFNDASIRFVFEETNERGAVSAYDAFRFQVGDTLVLAVSDSDCDMSDEADKVEVLIKNAAGEKMKRTLVEYAPKWYGGGRDSTKGMHTGLFMGVLKTCPQSDTNAPAKVIRVASDDLLTASYVDRENTDPGVPCERSVRIFAARPSEPEMTLFHVTKKREIDTSADAKVTLERIRRRPGNENVSVVYRDVLVGVPMEKDALSTTNPIPFNVSAGAIPVRVNDRSRARHAGSKVMIEAIAHSERVRAEEEGRDPDKVVIPLGLGTGFGPIRMLKGYETQKEVRSAGSFNGLIPLSLGPIDPNIEVSENAAPLLCVTGSDLVDITVLSEDGQRGLTRTVKLVSDATIGLCDSTFSAERNTAHVGESFFVKVDDADRDATDEPDRIEVIAKSTRTGVKRPMTLTETMPHSGVFTGRLRPVMFAPGEVIPNVATGGVATANEILTEERFAVGYGDNVIFSYRDEETLPGTPARTLSATGTVFRGANGDVRLFSKRFADRDMAVLVQFRLAECLFEQAKEHRKLKQPEKSAAAIDEGKFILEEALKNYPDSSHIVQGEFLLANLYQELANEQKDADDMEKATPLYQEALSRFAQILGTWPESEYAARSQYHKALCLEMLKDYNRASEEYVKMTYLYPESDLVSEATIRLATYYYTKEKRYDISGHIYQNFQQRFSQHAKAARALFMAGSCYIKQAESIAEEVEKLKAENKRLPQGWQARIDNFYRDAVKTFDTLVESYHDSAAKLRAQTLYWAGDVSVRRKDFSKAYQYLKRTVFEFPETEWARRARGLLLQEGNNFKEFD